MQAFGLLAISLLISLACWFSSVYFSPLTQVENWLLDLRVALLAQPATDTNNIVIVGITEETLEGLRYRQPVDRALLANLLERIDRASPTVIGLDVLLDQATEPEKDQRLMHVLQTLETPVFVAYATPQDNLTKRQLDYLNMFVPQAKRALVNLRRDSVDGVVRGVLAEDSSGLQGLANVMANSKRQIEILALQRGSGESLSAFPVYPAHVIESLPDFWFKGKQVLVGASLPMQDRYPTSFQALYGLQEGARPGVEIHAHAISNLNSESDYQRLGAAAHLPVFLLFTWLALLVGKSDWHWSIKFLCIASLSVILWAVGIGLMLYFQLVPLVLTPLLCLLLAAGAGVVVASRQHRSQKIFIRRAMSHYIAPEIVADLQKHPEKLSLGGERKELSMVFTDIAGFTSLSERLEPPLLLDLLNQYLHGMSEIVARYHGIVDKYIGDAVVALFNAPLDVSDHALQAVLCASELDHFAQAFMRNTNAQGLPWGETRIGVHTGEVIVGNMGGEKRFDYTAVGDAMNIASRLEGANKYLSTRICISENTVLAINCSKHHELGIEEVARVVLKGKANAMRVYTLHSNLPPGWSNTKLPCSLIVLEGK